MVGALTRGKVDDIDVPVVLVAVVLGGIVPSEVGDSGPAGVVDTDGAVSD